ncbi:MAG TPA: serine/threonine-protein kinase [Kofleriaceae bacterium]|nr:serine/threonine-protein kinase [Kofleriaceae bacterium]
MTPEDWQRITTAFDELSALDPHTRAERLAAIGREDPTQRDELVALLDAVAAAKTEGFLEHGPGLVGDLAGDVAARGDRLGPYQVVEEIGRGGMGTVYRARRADGAYEKEVAIKLIARGMDTERVVRRFLAERAILAELDHPSIARLLDGGQTDDGRPFFVMELVEGLPLDRWIAARKPPLRRRLDVFLALCDAVQRAHRSLVVHRDLKPANVIVGDDGTPRLLDFGIAKLLVPGAGATLDEQRLATPAYASPEQVRGQAVTTSTDIHGLGILLFVLLTGKGPFAGEGAALARAICDEPPPRPSAVATDEAARLRGDLDTIVAMAMRKEPERRYASVADLADDVRRHLDGLPVRARGDGVPYRAGRFARRHWIPLVAAFAVVAALIVGLVSTRRQAEVARRERALAERRLVQVRGLAAALVFDVDDAIAPLAGATPARRVVVERALAYLDALAAEGIDSPALARELVTGYRKLGDVQGSPANPNLGDTAGAEASYRKALAVSERWATRYPQDPEATIERAVLHDRLSALKWFAGDLDGAATLEGQALALLDTVPSTPDVERERITMWSGLADIRFEQERVADALALYQQALAGARERFTSTEARDRKLLATLHIKLGDAHRAGGNLDPAEAAYREALSLREGLSRAQPDSALARRDVSSALNKLVKVRKKRGDLTAAYDLTLRALAIDEATLAADPGDARARRDVAMSILELAQLEDSLGEKVTGAERRARWVSARARFEHALALFTKLVADGHSQVADAKLPDGIRQRIAALDEGLAAEPAPN